MQSIGPTALVGAVAVPSPVAQADDTASSRAADGAPVTTSISPWAKILSRVQTLEHADPSTLKATAVALAKTVSSAASKATDDDKPALTRLGIALDHVAKTGDASALKTAHHTHHAHAVKHVSGGTGALLTNLLQQIDIALGKDGAANSVASS